MLFRSYTTGTFAITQGATALVGTGTTWTAAMTKRKFAKGIGSPWYRFTRTGATTGTTAEDYAEATETASNYAIFQDEYDLPSTAETITAVHLLYPYSKMEQRTQQHMDDAYYVNPRTGIPDTWGSTETQTTAVRRIRISPVPNIVYRIRVRYLAAFTEVTIGGSDCVLGLNRQRAWLLASMYEAQRVGDAKQVTSNDEVEAAIDQAWVKEQPTSPLTIRKVPAGGRGGKPLYWTDDTTVVGL